MGHTYSEFRNLVKQKLGKNLSAWNLSDQQLEDYLKQEEDQVKGAYEGFLHPRANDDREEDVRFIVGAGTIAHCLEMCY